MKGIWPAGADDIAVVLAAFWGAYLLYDFGAALPVLARLAKLAGLASAAGLGSPAGHRARGAVTEPPKGLEAGPPSLVIARRLAGAAILGLLPPAVRWLAGSPFMLPGITGTGPISFRAAAMGLVLLVPILALAARSSVRDYPQIQREVWGPGLLAANLASWAVFLAGYELAFRGFFLLSLLPLVGEAAALAIMTAVYSAAHFRRGAGETIGAVPVGLLFGWLTLRTGNVWAAWLGHLLVAATAETTCLLLRPDRSVRMVRPARRS